jgi:hypothetical protein
MPLVRAKLALVEVLILHMRDSNLFLTLECPNDLPPVVLKFVAFDLGLVSGLSSQFKGLKGILGEPFLTRGALF